MKNIYKNIHRVLVVTFCLCLVFVAFYGCKTVFDDHNTNIGGVMHKEGYQNPLQNCAECHGADLKGSENASSCFSCHGKKWQ